MVTVLNEKTRDYLPLPLLPPQPLNSTLLSKRNVSALKADQCCMVKSCFTTASGEKVKIQNKKQIKKPNSDAPWSQPGEPGNATFVSVPADLTCSARQNCFTRTLGHILFKYSCCSYTSTLRSVPPQVQDPTAAESLRCRRAQQDFSLRWELVSHSHCRWALFKSPLRCWSVLWVTFVQHIVIRRYNHIGNIK